MPPLTLLASIPSPSVSVWEIGPFSLHLYGLCIALGVVAAVTISSRRWQARGGHPDDIQTIALWAVPFGLIGGRLYHVGTDWYRYFGDNGKGLSGALADVLDRGEAEAFVRASCSTFFHVGGTCAMGVGPESVVDPDLRVHGVRGLRVVDASVMPVLPSCNTNAPVIAVAERAADLITGTEGVLR